MPDPKTFQLSEPELQATIYYLTESEGGRMSPVASGYRGQLYYNGKDWDAMQQFIDKPWCNPGDSVQVYLQTASPEFHAGQFYTGQQFEIREGAKTVGKGTITAVLRDDFNYWEGKTFLQSLNPNIMPYSGDDLLGYRIDFDGYLTEINLIDDIIIEMTDNPECMMLVKCTVSDKNIQPWLLAETIIGCWKNQLAISKQLYKVRLEVKTDAQADRLILDKFVLTFASWHSIYLTGQIIVTQ